MLDHHDSMIAEYRSLLVHVADGESTAETLVLTEPEPEEEEDVCGDCHSVDYNCDGCDSCCWCGGTGNKRNGCDCNKKPTKVAVLSEEDDDDDPWYETDNGVKVKRPCICFDCDECTYFFHRNTTLEQAITKLFPKMKSRVIGLWLQLFKEHAITMRNELLELDEDTWAEIIATPRCGMLQELKADVLP